MDFSFDPGDNAKRAMASVGNGLKGDPAILVFHHDCQSSEWMYVSLKVDIDDLMLPEITKNNICSRFPSWPLPAKAIANKAIAPVG